MFLKAMQVLIILKFYIVEISNSFNPERQLKDTESAMKSKLIK